MTQRIAAPELAGFTFMEWLGGGGFADVFRYQDSLGRRVAVKVQHRGVLGEVSEYFEAEANLMARLSNHPNIVSVFQAGVASDGRPFIVMEECSTAHLGARIARRALTPSKAMEITVQIAGAVETAHRLGILHRDIKPANILFTEFERPALTDFGISASSDQQIATNALSPQWAPWEQYPDSRLTMGPWSDVFSLAATMWAMLVGRSPLVMPGAENDRLSIRHRVQTFQPPRTGRDDVPELLERVLMTALSADPEKRYPSALEFARAIQGVQGQLNEAVTPVDIRSDGQDYVDDEPELAETGTRIGGFQLIDPELLPNSGLTASVTGLTGGVTSSRDDAMEAETSAPPAGAMRSHIVQHGRGLSQHGLRDFTGPAIPVEQTRSVPDNPPMHSSATEGRQPRRLNLLGSVLIAGGIAAAVIAAMVGLWMSGVLGGASGTQATASPQSHKNPADPLSSRVPPVEDAAGKVTGATATFTWVNPDPRPADKYLVEELSHASQAPQQTVNETSVAVPVQAGRTCVDIRLRRASGQVSAPTRVCVES